MAGNLHGCCGSRTHDAPGGKSRTLLLPGIQKNCLLHPEMTGNYHGVGGCVAFIVSTFIEELKHEKEKKKKTRMNKCSHPDKPNKVLRESSF